MITLFLCEPLNKGANALICTIKFVIFFHSFFLLLLVVVANVSCASAYLHNQVCDFIIISLLSRNQVKLVVPLHEEALNVVFILESV